MEQSNETTVGPPPGTAAPAPRWWTLDRIEKSLSVALAFLGPVYALGLLALFLQIRSSYDLDLSAAWYAVSLASRMTVVGACLFVAFLTVALALLAIAIRVVVAVVLGLADRIRSSANEPPEQQDDEAALPRRARSGVRRRLYWTANPSQATELYWVFLGLNMMSSVRVERLHA